MRAQEAYNLSKSSLATQFDNVLKGIERSAKAGKFEYLEYKSACVSDTVYALRALGYCVDVGPSIVTISWDFQMTCKSCAEKDTTNHYCIVDN